MASSEPPSKKAKKESKGGDEEVDIMKLYNEKRKAVCDSVLEFKFNKKRVRLLTSTTDMKDDCKGILYWMWRDQRVQGRDLN